jgi:integrase
MNRKTKGRVGSRKIDIVTPYGRLCRHTGFYTAAQLRKVETIVDKLIEDAQLEVIKALHDGAVGFFQLVDADREGRLTGTKVLDAVRLREPLWPAVAKRLPKMGRGPETRKRYATSLVKLERLGLRILDTDAVLREGATVGDLSRVDWKAMRRLPDWRSAADWNHMRRAVSAFLTTFFGTEHHAFRRTVLEQIPVRKERPRRPDIDAAFFWATVARTPEHARPCYVTLAATGMRMKEYLACTEASLVAQLHAIDIQQTKPEPRIERIYVGKDLWDWVRAGIPSPLRRRWMFIHWKRAVKALGRPDIRLHDIRHLYGQVADEAGYTAESVAVALRHDDVKQSSGYKQRQVAREVAETVARGLVRSDAERPIGPTADGLRRQPRVGGRFTGYDAGDLAVEEARK